MHVVAEGGIGRIVLHRPDKKNALTQAMWCAIPHAVAALNADKSVRVIILCSSTPDAFAAGVDLTELVPLLSERKHNENNRVALRLAQQALARSGKPVIAQISGPCIGGGCGLAIHCDFRIAAEGATFGITPAKIGIIYPLNDTKELIDLVGVSNAKNLLFTARHINAATALEMGLIDQLVQPENLAKATTSFANEIASVSQYSLFGMKQFIQRVLDGQVDDDPETAEIFCAAHEGEDAVEGMRAFLEKRKPVFTWSQPTGDED